jgi:CheY-like chemotaxis protein
MSHDLRTPLNAVLGFAQLLNVERLSAPQVECVEQILKGGRHLLQLINEVLDIARIEAGRLSLSPEAVSVRDTVGHAAALIAPLAAQRHISVTIRESPLLDRAVRADRQRLSQVLLNLLSNAVKYNHDRGTVVLSFEEQAGRRLRINVTDTGPGIPRAKLRLLFTPFERLGAESTLVEGTGLGLTLARGLAEAMGGDVGVSSVVDQGSTFWVELDETDEPVPVGLSEHFAPISTEACRAATVLYIEDNLSNARLMERVLARRPAIRLVHAADGTHGLEAARSAHPDLILLDMHLPDMPGEEVLRLLFTDPLLRAIPTVVLSADAMPEQVKRVTAAGASAYLTKPLNVGEVLSVLDRLLAQRDETEESAGE